MTTTAHEDQFTAEPEPVRQPYDTGSILRRNVAALEVALRQQTELKEKAEAELAKLREQKPVAWINLNKWTPSNGPRCVTHEEYEKERELLTKLTAVYAAPAPAPAVPAEWRKVMAELAADLQAACDAEHPHRDQYPSVMRKYNNDMKIVEKARSLLQSADHSERNLEKVAPDCRNCANRVKRRCEACAILPCSCK